MSIAGLRIGSKIGLLVGLLFIPIGLLAWLFIQQSFKDIDFAQKERDGVAYAREAWAAFASLITASAGPDAAAPGAAARPANLAARGQQFDTAMDTGEAAKRLTAALGTLGWPAKTLARDKAEPVIAHARALLTKIADGSNLTLDPDLDSYYVMDVVTTKLPEVLDRAGSLLALARAQRGQARLSDDDKAELMIQLGQLNSAAAGVAASLDSAYKGNADGTTRARLEAAARAFAERVEAFAAEMKAVAVALREDATRSRVDLARLTSLFRDTATGTDALWHASVAELDRLLAARVRGFTQRLWTMLGIVGVVLALTLGFTLSISRQITRPLRDMAAAMDRIAARDYAVELPGLGRKDEIGQISDTLHALKESLAEATRLRRERNEEKGRAEEDRKARMGILADEFERAVGQVVETLSAASTELEAAATTLTSTAEVTQRLSAEANGASEQASDNVRSVATATEDMASSVDAIDRHVQESSTIAVQAVDQAQNADVRIAQLSQAAARIGDVVQLITAIAEQTNLLALNATIEAARAGEAGRGFAVVAQEVKALASQTAKATHEISEQIASMQTATRDSVAAIKEVGGTIARMAELASAIASAVAQQGEATHGISRHIREATDRTAHVAATVTEVSRGARETGSASTHVLASARSLASQSQRLEAELTTFLRTLRAA